MKLFILLLVAASAQAALKCKPVENPCEGWEGYAPDEDGICQCVTSKQCPFWQHFDWDCCDCHDNCPNAWCEGNFEINHNIGANCACECRQTAATLACFEHEDFNAGTCECECNRVEEDCAGQGYLEPANCECYPYDCEGECPEGQSPDAYCTCIDTTTDPLMHSHSHSHSFSASETDEHGNEASYSNSWSHSWEHEGPDHDIEDHIGPTSPYPETHGNGEHEHDDHGDYAVESFSESQSVSRQDEDGNYQMSKSLSRDNDGTVSDDISESETIE